MLESGNIQEIEEKLRNSFKAVRKDILELKTGYKGLDVSPMLLELKDQIKDIKAENSKLRKEVSDLNNFLNSDKKDLGELKKKVKKIKENDSFEREFYELRDLHKRHIKKTIFINKELKGIKEDKSFLRKEIDELKNLHNSHIKKTFFIYKNLRKLKNDKPYNVLKNEVDELRDLQNKSIKKTILFREDYNNFVNEFQDIKTKLDRSLITKSLIEKLDSDINSLKEGLSSNKKFERLKGNVQTIKFIKEKPLKDNRNIGVLRRRFEEVVDILAEDED